MREWLDSKTVKNGGWAGESLCHGVGLKALGAGDGSLYYYPSKGVCTRTVQMDIQMMRSDKLERKQKDFAENRQTLGIIQTSLVSALAKGAFEPSEPIWFNTLAMCRFRPLSHTSINFRVQKYYRLMKSFFVAKENLVFFRKTSLC